MWDLEGLFARPTASFRCGQHVAKASHTEHEDRPFSLQMLGQKKQGRSRSKLDAGDPRAHRLDREDSAPAQNLREIGEIGSRVAARRIDEIESLEMWLRVRHRSDPLPRGGGPLFAPTTIHARRTD